MTPSERAAWLRRRAKRLKDWLLWPYGYCRSCGMEPAEMEATATEIEELERSRDVALRNEQRQVDILRPWIDKAQALEKKVEHLRKFARHEPGCTATLPWSVKKHLREDAPTCTCGLEVSKEGGEI